MTITHTYTGRLTVVDCATCHMDFGVTDKFERTRRDDHKNFFCPAGHSNYYPGRSETERLQQRLHEANQSAASLTHQLDQTRAELSHESARRRGYQGQLTRTRRRIANGICPCCNRTFRNLARHMAGQHPEYVPETDGETTDG
jgi:hypothetical protein